MNKIPQPNCSIVNLYISDVSYESPKRYEEVDFSNGAPKVSQKIDHLGNISSNEQEPTIGLRVNVSAKYNDEKDTLFIAEVSLFAKVKIKPEVEEFQKGLFLQGTVLDILYNNSREIINSLLLKGNLPAYQLQFVSFEQEFIARNRKEFEEFNKKNNAQ